MTLDTVLNMLLGAALVSVGVLVNAAADKIRGLKVSRKEARMTERQPKRPTPARGIQVTSAHEAMARDVAAVLTGAGYPKQHAAEAVASCLGAECSTIESWTRAALKRAGKNAVAS